MYICLHAIVCSMHLPLIRIVEAAREKFHGEDCHVFIGWKKMLMKKTMNFPSGGHPLCVYTVFARV